MLRMLADEITVSAPFLRALVALSVSKSTRSQGADTVISSAPHSQTEGWGNLIVFLSTFSIGRVGQPPF
jgi:hypothetical protein